ncbi:MAG: tetratricopeptide repeat protein [Anaerolineae bacterium]|nr:tetratricopeptide repeat protein [Anaerolineae bacterium]MDW8172672.1 tetratricopeptide repeat protein [Anaerolineae bacterium]
MTALRRFWPALLLVLSAFGLTQAIGEVTPVPTQTPQTTPIPATATPAPAVPSDPNATERLLDEALSALQAGRFQDAIALMDQLIASNPSEPDAFFFRGVGYAQLQDYARAIADYTRAIELKRYMWTYYAFRADAHLLARDASAALRDYDQAIELNPRYTEAFRGRALAHQVLGNSLRSQIDALIAEGLTSAARGDNFSAINSFTLAIDSTTEPLRVLADAYYNRALARYTDGNLTAAIEDYGLALEIYPRMHDSYLGRGIANRENGDLRQAGRDFLQRIEILESNTQRGTIQRGQPVTVPMAYGTVHRLTFEARGGDFVTISARDLEDTVVDPLIVILGPNGEAIAGDDDFGRGLHNLDSLIEGLRLAQDGTYTIVVSHANGGFDGPIVVSLD